MIRATVTICFLLIAAQSAFSQIDSTLFRSWSFAVAGNEYGYDTGLGVELSSPGLVNGRICLRLKASTVWMESYWALRDRWARFQLVEVMAVYQFAPVERARPYLEAGLIEVFPSRKFSDVTSRQGVAVRAGVELFVHTSRRMHMVYFFGGGINQVRAVAEKLDNAPTYANGFVFTTGLRFYVPVAR